MKGSVTKRKDGRWQGTVEVGIVDGKRVRKYVYADKERDCQKLVTKLIHEINTGIYRDPQNATVKTLVAEWLANHKVESTTMELYRYYEEKQIADIASCKINLLTTADIEKFYNKKLDKLSGNTVRKIHAFLHTAFNYAIKKSWMAFNPFDTVTLPKKTNFKPNILSEKEFCNLISAVSDTYDEIVILLAGVAGLRRSEIFALRWTDINFDKCQITIKKAMVRFRKYVEKDPKSEASKRTIYAPAFVFDKLKAYRASLKVVDEYVCSKYKADSYSKHFKKLTSKLGINDIRLHDLRHFNAIMMMRSGVPDKVAARRGGWSQVATLREIYQHSTDEADRQASERLGTALNLTDILTDMKNTMP